ncbi:peptidoglycan binding domain-containing protein [Kitasatospora sp. MAP5-34]|uniref:peptidoglycan binding domain-containing protein n=1 Tax=Kitasatospora sp. MAP5-34 TaxID=3035102 RepID=UPI0024755EC1|nr:peptidoglycan binding domain-containing protein [Kitasatospora sp. MAP5-34]MDH6575492.1 hypothetical protein [Kitasatospora sp. MAP5-34]
MSSRESDSAYPSPRQGGSPGRRQGEGADAYPSGTPPYGTGLPNGLGTGPAEPAGMPDGDDVPKTETTLTTRVRINIPGSRPIPPVVVRSTVKNEEAPAEPTGPRHRSGASASPVLGVVDSGERTTTPPNLPPEWQQSEREPAAGSSSESTGEWFRPRQRSQSGPAPVPAGAAPRTAAPSPAPAPGMQSPQATKPARSAQPSQGPGPLPNGTPASPFSGNNAGRRAAEGQGPSQQQNQHRSQGQQQGGGANGRGPAFGGAPFAADPYSADPYRQGPPDPFAPDPFATGPADPFTTAPAPTPATDPFATQRAPQRGPRQSEPPRATSGSEDTQVGGFAPARDDLPTAAIPGLPTTNVFGATPQAPQTPQTNPANPGNPRPAAPKGADPFATNRQPAQAAQQDPFGPAQPARGGRFADVSYEPAPPFPGTLGNTGATGPTGPTGATPTAPAGFNELPRPGRPQPTAQSATQSEVPEAPEAPETEASGSAAGSDDKPAAAAPRRRSKAPKLAAYAVGGLLFAGAAAYGTGLMLNQADIPSGTTVLGTNIGGDARDQALSLLDGTVGKAGQRPVQLKVGDQTVNLDPTAAGLSFDTTATVDALTKHSYNPVEVIGSLAGGSKAVAPEVKIDEAKLKAALETLGGNSGQGLQEGFVRFTPDGQTEVVPGRAGQAVDATAALGLIEQAYRNRAAGQPDTVLTVPVTAAQPKVSTDALQAAANSLGKAVLNGNVTVMAGTKRFEFGKSTAAKALTLVPDASGTVALKWDYDKLNDALGGAFDKSKTKKNGVSSAITPQDVADGIASVFDKTAAKDRVFRFPAG